jgi:hypothetical protein
MFNKKLLFSGCSFTAGDELVWDTYTKEILKIDVDWFSSEKIIS